MPGYFASQLFQTDGRAFFVSSWAKYLAKWGLIPIPYSNDAIALSFQASILR
jgi:hypothetical protein